MAKKAKQTTKFKGNKKFDKDSDDNPLLKVNNNSEFEIEFYNVLNDPSSIIFSEYEVFNIETGNIDINQLNRDSEIVAIMRYYEYVCIAKFKYNYILPLLETGEMTGPEIFQMIQHALRTKLLIYIPSFDTVLEFEFRFKTKIKYI